MTVLTQSILTEVQCDIALHMAAISPACIGAVLWMAPTAALQRPVFQWVLVAPTGASCCSTLPPCSALMSGAHAAGTPVPRCHAHGAAFAPCMAQRAPLACPKWAHASSRLAALHPVCLSLRLHASRSDRHHCSKGPSCLHAPMPACPQARVPHALLSRLALVRRREGGPPPLVACTRVRGVCGNALRPYPLIHMLPPETRSRTGASTGVRR
ncbi:MAG: hypothetical protein J3K34DRAFT_86480 [Monoraphidium minutum]|nr:MAG: hypothetical protein J3K34DRAFT_86480 [Monoraphidium minutum]